MNMIRNLIRLVVVVTLSPAAFADETESLIKDCLPSIMVETGSIYASNNPRHDEFYSLYLALERCMDNDDPTCFSGLSVADSEARRASIDYLYGMQNQRKANLQFTIEFIIPLTENRYLVIVTHSRQNQKKTDFMVFKEVSGQLQNWWWDYPEGVEARKVGYWWWDNVADFKEVTKAITVYQKHLGLDGDKM